MLGCGSVVWWCWVMMCGSGVRCGMVWWYSVVVLVACGSGGVWQHVAVVVCGSM